MRLFVKTLQKRGTGDELVDGVEKMDRVACPFYRENWR